jgi:hypothetical protein
MNLTSDYHFTILAPVSNWLTNNAPACDPRCPCNGQVQCRCGWGELETLAHPIWDTGPNGMLATAGCITAILRPKNCPGPGEYVMRANVEKLSG